PAASLTRSTTTYVPGFSDSVLKRNVSTLLSNRPSVGNTLTHFLPLTANEAAVNRASGSAAVASRTTWSPSVPATLTVTAGGSCDTTNGPLTRSPLRASSGGLSLRSLATTFTS